MTNQLLIMTEAKVNSQVHIGYIDCCSSFTILRRSIAVMQMTYSYTYIFKMLVALKEIKFILRTMKDALQDFT